MRSLLIDTATDRLVTGVAEIDTASRTGRLLGAADITARRRANVDLLPRTLDLLESLHLVPEDIGGVVCGRGPGSFTGVRIGVATAKGVASGLGVPLWGASTLDAVAYGLAHAGVTGEVGVVGDAMRQEVYPARYTILPGGTVIRRTADLVEKPAVTVDRWRDEGERLILAGDGLAKYGDAFAEGLGDLASVTPEGAWVPTAQGMLDAFLATADLTRRPHPGVLLPVYTRLSDAEETERQRSGLDLGRAVPESGVAGEADARDGLDRMPQVPSVRIRRMTPALAEAIFNPGSGIEATPGVHWSAESVIEELGRTDRLWLAAVKDGRPVGYIGVWFVDTDMQVLAISVHESARRTGVGSALMERALADVRARSAERLTLEVSVDNADALAFYEQDGFVSDGIRPGFYHGGIDAAIMSRPLSRTGAPRILAIESSCDETERRF